MRSASGSLFFAACSVVLQTMLVPVCFCLLGTTVREMHRPRAASARGARMVSKGLWSGRLALVPLYFTFGVVLLGALVALVGDAGAGAYFGIGAYMAGCSIAAAGASVIMPIVGAERPVEWQAHILVLFGSVVVMVQALLLLAGPTTSVAQFLLPSYV